MGWTIDPPRSPAVLAVIEARGNVDASAVHQALREAVERGAPGWIDGLAEHVDVHQDLGNGRTALHEAARAGHRQLVERLVEIGGDAHQPDADGQTPVSLAAEPALALRLDAIGGFGRAARAIVHADVDGLRSHLRADPSLVRQRVLGETLTHVVVLWPGHRPRAAELIAALAEAGADLSAAADGPFGHRETPLHGAVSSNDLAAATALVDGGAELDAPGAVIGNGPPLADAVVFRKWACAHLLVLRGCRVNLPYAAALGRLDLVRRFVSDDGTVAAGACDLPGWPPGSSEDVALELALHLAVHGGQLGVARWLRERGAVLDWVGPSGRSTKDAAEELAEGWRDL
ncbi:MAG: ankyrin repeat domain-containing protein [Myxococcota bacterium]